uniref:myotubularin-related protein 5-like isoform X1 n=1 Tax=Styela clava TaxID=7725 RepID=UPI00193A9187|nr:myotubularin-related protein 5-like isoform X1 [Styela clava]
MDRLVDYFAVVGYDFINKDSPDAIKGKVITRIPEQDWKDEPFITGIELFCQPTGWFLSKEKQPPKYFVSVLTDAYGKRHYCAVLSFSEPLHEHSGTSPLPPHLNNERPVRKGSKRLSSSSPICGNYEEMIDESMCQVEGSIDDTDCNGLKASAGDHNNETQDEFSPMCLVLLSRYQEFTVLKNCLGLIYTIYIEGLSVSLETVVANLLAVHVPPRGSSIFRFSIGAADKQAIQSPQYEELPITRSSVSTLLHQLGILNVMNILCAALVDQKLLFYSCSFTRLTESCNALTALMFPFSYSYPYIPILPQKLLECTSSPTPFLIGVHSSLKSELYDLPMDVVTVDLDGGVISVPEGTSIPGIPEPYYTRAVELLTKVLCPDLAVADYAYPPEHINTSEPEKLDKEIRAIFLRLFCQLLMGYRSCLQVCRIHPRPIIRFQKDLFLNVRGYDRIDSGISAEFMPKLVESQAFSLFVQEEGPPYRRLNIFDREVAKMPEQMKKEGGDISKALRHIKDIAYELDKNERPTSSPPLQKVPKPTDGAYLRPNQLKFPRLSPTAVQTFMTDKANNLKNEFKNIKPTERPSIRVPDGAQMSTFSPRSNTLTTSSRRLEVLRSCVQFIFENRTLETKKIFSAVLRALKNRSVREALTQELIKYAKLKPQLDNQQFGYIARLCNSALDDCSSEDDEYIVAADLLPALLAFYRKLCPTVMQFLYTVVQEHAVWSSIEFWEYTFFSDVQNEMCRLYQLKKHGSRTVIQRGDMKSKDTSNLKHENVVAVASAMKRNASAENIAKFEQNKEKNTSYDGRDNAACLEIAATELRDLVIKSEKEKKDLALAEEGVIVGQIQHVSQRMVFMLVPLDIGDGKVQMKFLRNSGRLNEDSSNSFFTSSLGGSVNGSIDDDSFAYQSDGGDVKSVISKFVSMFVDRTCSETGISADFSKSLLNKVPSLVLMQHESLHDVSRESKRLPPIKKAKLLQPTLLPGETLYTQQTLRAYLSGDGRMIATGGSLGGPSLLPAEGAIFVSNYRIMFIGIPCDTLASEQVVIRSFPISGLHKVKQFSDNDKIKERKIESHVQHWCVLYSTTFQLFYIGFDEDVTDEQRETFEEKILALRNPATIEGTFAIRATSRVTSSRSPTRGGKKTTKDGKSPEKKQMYGERTHTKHGAKHLVKQAKRKAGMTLGKQPRLSRLMMTDSRTKTLYFSPTSEHNDSMDSTLTRPQTAGTMDRLSSVDETLKKTLSDRGTMDMLFQRGCRNDYRRMKLIGGMNEQFRLTTVNRMFSVCRSYPVCSIVPKSIADDSVRSLSHCHHLNRFPAVTWMHPTTKAVLVRAGAIRSRTITAVFKHGQTSQPLSDEGTLGSSAEEERFLGAIIDSSKNSSPTKVYRPDSLLFNASDDEPPRSPKLKGNNGFANSFRENRPESISGLKSVKKWGTLSRATGKPEMNSYSKTGARLPLDRSGNGTLNVPGSAATVNYKAMARKSQLYVFAEKSLLKSLKQEQQGRVEFVPIDVPEPKQVRLSFKSLLKVCLPVDPPPQPQSAQSALDDNQQFRKGVEESGWLQQISSLLSVSGAVVDILDTQGSSVVIAMEDGWDVTPQLTALAQIMSDPYYRTIEGFQILIQKEWLSFGHRFSHRNHFNETISSGFTPIFLQFLDCVYQILHQFPLAFEFNSMLIQTIAFHCTSNRFNTFILDSDFERLEAGILLDTKYDRRNTSSSVSPDQKTSDNDSQGSRTKSPRNIKSLWEYIDLAHERSTVFVNTLYCPDHLTQNVLRPVSSICRLRIWPYYTQEWLGDCPQYDGLLGELSSTGTRHNEQEQEASEAWEGQSGRRIINRCYDNTNEVQPDSICSLVQQIEHLQNELGKPNESWKDIWISAMTTKRIKYRVPSPTHAAREQAKLIHKRSTVDIIVKSLEIVPTSDFGPGIRTFSFLNTFNPMRSNKEDTIAETSSLVSEMGTLRPENEDNFDTASLYHFQSNSSEVRTYEGVLYKQGAYMKSWKQRYFVLDSTKHQLRQYESKLDVTCKSIFDLKEVISVCLIDSVSSPPKTVEDKSFFEIKTAKRVYHFIAESNEAAVKWIDVLQNALEA